MVKLCVPDLPFLPPPLPLSDDLARALWGLELEAEDAADLDGGRPTPPLE